MQALFYIFEKIVVNYRIFPKRWIISKISLMPVVSLPFPQLPYLSPQHLQKSPELGEQPGSKGGVVAGAGTVPYNRIV